ncbi:MAG: hypothetical protein R3C10_19335 [Pirellulales bacterium]
MIGGEKVGRYSFLTADPFLRIEAYDRRVVVTESGARRRRDYERVHLGGPTGRTRTPS